MSDTFEMQCQSCGAVRRTNPVTSSVQIDRCSCGAFDWRSPIKPADLVADGTTGHLALARWRTGRTTSQGRRMRSSSRASDMAGLSLSRVLVLPWPGRRT